MDDPFGKLSDRLAQPTSRRGFIGTIVKVGLGGAAALSGGVAALSVGQDLGVALAAPACCAGPSPCQVGSCPPNTTPTDVGFCCLDGVKKYECYDCCSMPSGDYICTYAVNSGTNCPQARNTAVHPE